MAETGSESSSAQPLTPNWNTKLDERLKILPETQQAEAGDLARGGLERLKTEVHELTRLLGTESGAGIVASYLSSLSMKAGPDHVIHFSVTKTPIKDKPV